MVCGFGDAVELRDAGQQLAGAALDKASRFTDWAHRPLTERQIRYALADVIHLRTVYEKLQQLWRRTAARLVCRGDGGSDRSGDLPRRAGRGVAPLPAARPRRPQFFGVLRDVAAWREAAAQQRDLPRGRIMRDEAVLEIASHAPRTIEALGHAPAASAQHCRGQARAARSSKPSSGASTTPIRRPALRPKAETAARARPAGRVAAGPAEAALRGLSGGAEAGGFGRRPRSDRRRRPGPGPAPCRAGGARCSAATRWR